MKLLKILTDFLAGPIGSFGHFLGRSIADGYLDRMEEIAEEEHTATQQLISHPETFIAWTDETDIRRSADVNEYPPDEEDSIFAAPKKGKAGHGSN